MYSKLVLVIFTIILKGLKSDNAKSCFHKCLDNSVTSNPNSNIDVYLEYKKATIKVVIPTEKRISSIDPFGDKIPGTLNYQGKHKNIWKRDTNKIDEVSLRDFQVNPEQVQCSEHTFNRKEIKCKPRNVIVTVVSTEAKIYPNKVLVKQCSGYCGGNRNCVATLTRDKSVSVTLMQNNVTKCGKISVPEDVKCKCRCAIKKKDCNPKQLFDRKTCSCRCASSEEKDRCRTLKNHYWDPSNCTCSCKEGSCTTGAIWDKTLCRCSKKTDNG
ncbi:hypothetical protein ABEB36_005987 [Hypothenemus hampei]|uniref:Platelet-derived growth factor (PDGF) family profile domain-containing protein n=1 Tax=Hypothenemus hampei TaxID=57062 RepID=A0ABD1F042_HYPHA